MNTADELEIRKSMASSASEETIKILERLDEKSRTLAKTYLSALADRQRMDAVKACSGK